MSNQRGLISGLEPGERAKAVWAEELVLEAPLTEGEAVADPPA